MKRAVLVFSCFVLSACLERVGPDYQKPVLETPGAYSVEIPKPAGSAQTALWWQGFADDGLNALVEEALGENLAIAAAEARLAEARALVDVARAEGAPQLDAAADGDSSLRLSGNRRGDGEVDLGTGLLFSWSPDLFGGRARQVEAAEAEVLRRTLLRDDTARLTVAEVVTRYFEVRREHARLEIIEASLALQRQTLEIVRRRFQVGLAAQLDVSRAEAELAATRASRGPLLRDLAAAQTALAVLLNRPPSALGIGTDTRIPRYGGGPDIGLPRDLLRARPDVRASEAALARATAEIGIAEAELYPQLTIPGALTASVTGIGSSDIVEALIATLAANLEIPLFDSGGRRAAVSAAEARTREALLEYRQRLLNALAEVESALARLMAAQQRREDLHLAVNAAEVAFQQAQQLYTQGLIGFLDVLISERVFLENRQNLAEAQAEAGLAIADLYSAVGAPFLSSEQEPSRPTTDEL